MPLHTRRFAVILCIVFTLIADVAASAIYTVTNTADSGAGSLRDAIEQANANSGPDTIVFAISSGPQSISLLVEFPAITEAVTIDGTSQPGYAGVPLIEISGVATPSGNQGFFIPAPTGGSTIRGLMINSFPGNGITLGSDGITVEDCYIGTDSTRTQNLGNGGSGIHIFEGDDNLIQSNVIAFNAHDGVTVQDGSTGAGYPDFIGTPDFTGTFSAIDFTDDCGAFHMVGGPIIIDTSGRTFLENFGMRLTGTVNISTGGTYAFNLPVLDDGARILVDSVVVFDGFGPGPQSGSIGLSPGSHTIEIAFSEGGGAAGLRLVIDGPGSATLSPPGGGVGLQGELFQARVPAERNRISMNSIFDNGNQGIALGCCCVEPNDAGDIDPGPNTFLNRPEITVALSIGGDHFLPSGTAPPNAAVEFFASTNDSGWQGYGEGKIYLGSTIADGGGNFSGDVILPQPYYTITATATDVLGNTSEFSASFPVRPNLVVVTSLSDSGPGTLRDAIDIANSDGFDTLITFEPTLSGGTISLMSPLPALTENGTTINGDPNGDCIPDVELEASSYVGDVIAVQSAGNTIRGLAINRFSNFAGIHIAGPGNTALCNYVGTDLTGSVGYAATGQGILIESGGNSIRDNLISACLNGVHIVSANSNDVFANVFGLSANGATTIPNDVGILISGGGSNNTIGIPSGPGNRIVSRVVGVSLSGNANNNNVNANDIRWPSGSSIPTNIGILIQGTANRVGELGANRIENNGSSGIRVVAVSFGNSLRGNTITENGGLGIDLEGDGVTPNDSGDSDGGANARMNFPTLTSATTNGTVTTVQGFLDTPSPQDSTIDIFVSAAPDVSGYGEGSMLLGTLSPSISGSFSVTFLPTPIGSWITATATDTAGNTSEFSAATLVIGPAIFATNLVAIPRSSSSIELRWTDPQQSETGFRIERQNGPGWGTVGSVGANATSFTDSGLGPSQTHHYRVIAVSPAGDAPPSNLASATTHAANALKVCRQTIGATHQAASATSVAFNGTNYGVAWADKRDGLEEEIYFQLRSGVDGSSIAPAVRITNDDMPSRLPTLRWNGTNFGLLWTEHVRPPGGQATVRLAFATLSATGAIMRDSVRAVTNLVSGNLATDGEMPLIWDGSAWGVFLADAFTPTSSIAYLRFDVDGDLITGPLSVTPTGPNTQTEVSAAWNGSEYGLAWVEQSGNQWQIRFKRMLPDGTLVGSGATTIRNQGPITASGVNLIADGMDWAVAWSDLSSTESVVMLLRLNRDGTTKGPAARMSDDGVVFDEVPRLFLKSGGGYVAFVSSFDVGAEVMRLEADAAGQRVGTRLPVSGDPSNSSLLPHAATDGTSFLVAWEENVEIGATVVSSAGITGPLQIITTNHTPQWNVVLPGVARHQGGFIATWGESGAAGIAMRARLYRLDGTIIDKVPLIPAPFFRKSPVIATGGDFALAWTDDTGAVRFDRFDQNGDTLMSGGIEISAVANLSRAPALAYNGELWGITWVESNQVRFRRANTTAALSPIVTIPSNNPNDLQLQWIGSSWVLVWRQTSDLWFARLDSAGALLAGPSQITFTGGVKNEVQLAWAGENLGLAWSENRFGQPNFSEVVFTVLETDGTKRFTEVTAVTSRYEDRLFALIADNDRFRVVYQEPMGGIREVEVSVTGTLGATRFLGNHGEGRIAAATNGLITGMAWLHGRDLYFQTTACLTDATPPPCPSLNAPFTPLGVSMTWNSVTDPDSSILSYNVYRDGALIGEVRGSSPQFFPDHGFTPGATHVYEVRALNGAYLESTGCTTRTVVAGINVLPTTLPDARVNTNYNQTFTAVGGTSPFTFAVTSGALPTNVALNGGSGQLNGQPSPAGAHTFTITATDSASLTGARAYVLRVCSINPLPVVLANGQVGNAYSQAVVATAGIGGVTYAVTSGSLPAGLTFNSLGELAGTPTTVASSTFTITATDSIGCTMFRSYTVQISSGTAPRNLGATTQSSSAILLRWTDPQKSETGFRIERSVDGTTWVPIDIVGANATSFTSGGLSGATFYYFRIVAVAASGDAGTSNVATAMTFPASAAKVCATSVGSFFSAARFAYVAHNGTQWAMAWEERNATLGNTEIFFQLLDQATGQRVGSPVRVSNNDMFSIRPILAWNGTHFGLLWIESLRGPAGELAQVYRFALLDASGNLLRRDVRVATQPSFGSQPLEIVWDGSGWAFLEQRVVAGQATELFFHRLDADGDVTNANVQITTHPDFDVSARLAWNGTHFGVLWVRARDQYGKLYFQRLNPTGGVVGTALELAFEPENGLGSPDIIADGTGWTVSYSQGTPTELASYLIRLDATGAPLAPASRLSDATDLSAPGFGVRDDFNDLYAKPGGGYVVYVRSQIGTSRTFEVARLEADATGNRVGARIVLSTVDTFVSGTFRSAFDGSNFLIAWNEGRAGTQEIADAIVSPTGTITAGPTDLTTGHSVGNSLNFVSPGNPVVAPVGSGFATLWTEPVAVQNQIHAQIFDGNGVTIGTGTPLTATNTRGRPGVVGVGNTFAVAWKNSANAVLFARYDSTGAALISEAQIATGAGGSPGVSVAWNGEVYGLAFLRGPSLTLQKVSAAGAAVGTAVTVIDQTDGGITPQIQWTGSGWAFLWVAGNELYYALLDADGAFIVRPIQVTFSPTIAKSQFQLLWNGEKFGVVWGARPLVDPPGQHIAFTVLNAAGIKEISETIIAEDLFDQSNPSLNWNLDHFRLTWFEGTSSTLREIDILPSGATSGPSRMLSNRGGQNATAWNGVTLGVLVFQNFFTSACLADSTPPSCPAAAGSQVGDAVRITWSAATDAESGVYQYHVYRDGTLLAEVLPTATSFDDRGFIAGMTHSYAVRAVNGAYRDSAGCASIDVTTVLPVPASLIATATSATQVALTWNLVGGVTYEVLRKSNGGAYGVIGSPAVNNYTDNTATADTTYLYVVRSVGAGGGRSANSALDLATTVMFANDPLTAGTLIAAQHVTQLRTAVNAVRVAAGQGPFSFTDPILAGGAAIKAVHLTEIRSALDAARTALGVAPVSYTDVSIVAGVTVVKAAHFQEPRNGVK